MKKGEKWAFGICLVIVIMIFAIMFVTPEILGLEDKSVYDFVDALTFGKFWDSEMGSSMSDYSGILKEHTVKDLGLEQMNFFGIISFARNVSKEDTPPYIVGGLEIEDFNEKDTFFGSSFGGGGSLHFPAEKEMSVSGEDMGSFLQELMSKDEMPISVQNFQIETISPGKVFATFTGYVKIPDEEFAILSSSISSVKQNLPFKAEFVADIVGGKLTLANDAKNVIFIDNLSKEQSKIMGTLGFNLLELDKTLKLEGETLEESIFEFLIQGINKMGHSMTANGTTINLTTNRI